MIISLDISTKTIGVCIWKTETDLQGAIVQIKPQIYFATDLSKHESLFQKLDAFSQEFITNTLMNAEFNLKTKGFDKLEEIVIEEPFTFFSSGKSNANTMAKLSAFNCLVSNYLRELTGLTPTYVNVNSLRATIGLNQLYKSNSADSKKQKKQLNCKFVEEKFDISLPRSTKKNVKYNYLEKSEDIADSILIALGGYTFQNIKKGERNKSNQEIFEEDYNEEDYE